jgi:hypothetical protein
MGRRLLITLGLAALIASAAACGDDNKDDGSSGQPTTVSNNDSEVPTFPHTTPGPETPPPVDAEATTTASGLQIIDIKEGTGTEAVTGKYVIVHYTGWFESDSTKFDSSRDRDQPFPVILGQTPAQVIQGWEEGLLGMKEGGQRRLIIPPGLGYGADGAKDRNGNVIIPPDTTLIFDIELIDVQDVP